MSSKLQKPIRIFGQRSIDSTFRKLPSDSSTSSNDLKGNEGRQGSHKSTPVSLSDFLDRKLRKSSLVLGRIQGKPTPFSSPLGLGTSGVKNVGNIEQVDKETTSISDRVIFENFKHNDEEKGDFIGPSGVNETENSVEDDTQDSRKRKNSFAGLSENHTVKRQVVTLGGESTRRQIKRTATHSSSNKRRRPLYNHYKNGCGWWDCDMEGIDNEEVGFHEVWEGVGSTSLGEIVDWH
ncbi:uncharacterized protein LOC114730620 [Neltuma alba]|uniref:uncharacterized protein LOC114730620 n=1 Tax=Neltuma alba TaxID=207710 RepID=UPI0010A33590|nr:uncharacterized protein LOC114730620 [Prosopis alba]XP_028773566.1 uncharacterized protein LOC114730620 [Prosopis alba]